MLRALIKKIQKVRYPHVPLISVRIDKESILNNLQQFNNVSNECTIAPVLKSNAYGHGLTDVARILDNEDISFLIVESYFEAIALRSKGIKKPILVIGYTQTENILKHNLKKISFTIIDTETLKQVIADATKTVHVHIKIDTGMNRQGIQLHEVNEAIKNVSRNPHIVLEGICSHFADADNPDESYTNKQIDRWNAIVKEVKEIYPRLPYYHISATAGHGFNDHIEANMTRLGLGLYGIKTGAKVESKILLKPALELKTIISSVKKIQKGDKVGYGTTFTAPHDMKIATLPVGYFEGVDRRLSNCGYVKIHNSFAPIIGRVSMNITVIDVTDIFDIKVKDSVVVISSDPNDRNSVEQIAKQCETIPYEILIHIPQHLRREVK